MFNNQYTRIEIGFVPMNIRSPYNLEVLVASLYVAEILRNKHCYIANAVYLTSFQSFDFL